MSIKHSVAVVKSVALTGFKGEIIEVETDTNAGLPSLQIVGMGNKAIDEARHRVRSAVTNSLLQFPARKVTVNLAPAELPKDGTHLDLPIALSILVSSGQLKATEVRNAIFAGELALNGDLRPIRGAIVIAEAARDTGVTTLFLPTQNAAQARLVNGITIIGVTNLKTLYQHLRGFLHLPQTDSLATVSPTPDYPSIDSIIGLEQAKRALLIAAAGRHNILLSGPPGTGKTLLARTLAGLLPPLVDQEIIEVTKLYSLSNDSSGNIYTQPPLRAPHHTVTLTALIGGGLRPRPGDISLAHKGVLFLDELPEYPRSTIEALRQPLEDRTVTLSRLYGSITYPADVLLVATSNPCPCGFLDDSTAACTCTASQITHYEKKLSGPLLDRIDLKVVVHRVDQEQFFSTKSLINNQQYTLLKNVKTARLAQAVRYKCRDYYNAYASLKQTNELFNIEVSAIELLATAARKMNLTNRGYLRVLRVARTIADIENSEQLKPEHVAEALQFR